MANSILTPHAGNHLPRWGYIVLSIACAAMGVWASFVTLEYFRHGARALELVEQGAPERKKDEFFGELDGGGNAGQGQVFSGSDGSEGTGAAAPAEQTSSQLVRTLEDGVKILAFDGGKEIEDLYYVSYYPNGMCDGYQIEIGDSENRTATITVDPVTGKAKVGK